MLQRPRDASSPKRSPWRRALNKLTPPRSGTKSSDDKNKKNKGIFSSQATKLKSRRSKKKAAKLDGSSKENEEVVTVQVLPKSPMRYVDSRGMEHNISVVRSEPSSPPRIIKPSGRALETEEAFNEMFEAYIMRFHDHGVFSSEGNESCSLCSKGKQIIPPPMMVLNIEKKLSASSVITNATFKSRDTDTMSVISNAMSEVTIPISIMQRLTPQEVVNRFTLCVSQAADAFTCPCVAMMSTREDEVGSNYDTNSDTEDDDVEHDDGEALSTTTSDDDADSSFV